MPPAVAAAKNRDRILAAVRARAGAPGMRPAEWVEAVLAGLPAAALTCGCCDAVERLATDLLWPSRWRSEWGPMPPEAIGADRHMEADYATLSD